ncbi:hypothetical protein BDC45DRAFT_567530 [Circinella umbellata]|nr:hypothetical protein BDC45DRAFT_567530 [Circinella umbellata]
MRFYSVSFLELSSVHVCILNILSIATLRNHKSNTLAILLKALDGFVDKGGYHHLQIMKENDMLLAVQDDTNEDLNEAIIEHTSKLMEAIVLGETFWFTLTHFDANIELLGLAGYYGLTASTT